MTADLELTVSDLQAILASLVRGALLQANKPHFLFADSASLDERTPMQPGITGLEDVRLQQVAGSFTQLLGVAPDFVQELLPLPTLGAWAEAALPKWRDTPKELVFLTSGSTGEPTACRQAFALLQQEIRAQADIFGGHARIVSMVPRHHIYGFLFCVLLPKVLDVPVVEMPLVPSESQIEALHAADLVVAFPMFWKTVSTLSAAIPPGVNGVTSTGPCPAETIRALLNKGLHRMTEVYGSSETGGLGTRHHPDDAYTLLPYWRREADLPDGPTALVRALPDGETMGPVFAPDLLHWETERTFRPVKRQDRAVQVAGVNVYPQKVADCIRSHPNVRECAVRLMRPEEGQRLKAFIVLRQDADEAQVRRELRAWLVQRLLSAEMPKSLTFGRTLPSNSMGKDADWD